METSDAHVGVERELAKPRECSTQMAAQNPLLVVYETPLKTEAVRVPVSTRKKDTPKADARGSSSPIVLSQ